MKNTAIDNQRMIYKGYQDLADRWAVGPKLFNAIVRAELKSPNPTPNDWIRKADIVLARISGGRCCPKATVVPCVCEVSYKCPDHGVRCRGSHD